MTANYIKNVGSGLKARLATITELLQVFALHELPAR